MWDRHHNSAFTQNTDGTFSIIDIADPTTPIEQTPTEAEALAKIDQIYTQYSLNKSKQVIDNLLYIKGLTQSSVAGEIAQKQARSKFNYHRFKSNSFLRF